MSLLVLLRALSGLALPMAFGYGVFERRRRGGRDEVLGDEPAPVANAKPRPTRGQLRDLDDPHDLHRFDVRGADLRKVSLAGADLTGLDLRQARLRHCNLEGSTLQFATLDYADLRGANLRGADLHGATLLEADLSQADLRGADLRGTRQLLMANLRGSVSDRTTKWPHGFSSDADR